MRKHFGGTPRAFFTATNERDARALKVPPPGGDMAARRGALSEKGAFFCVIVLPVDTHD